MAEPSARKKRAARAGQPKHAKPTVPAHPQKSAAEQAEQPEAVASAAACVGQADTEPSASQPAAEPVEPIDAGAAPANAEPSAPGKNAGENFAGSVLKYSVATYLGFGITGAAILVQGILGPERTALPAQFMNVTATLMYLGILGLDQSLLRFYHEPPEGHSGRALYAVCVHISKWFLFGLGLFCTLFFSGSIAEAVGFSAVGGTIVPFLFLNALFYMQVRYLNVLLRLENNVRAYTAETLWMQACYNLIYLLPGFFSSSFYSFAFASILGFFFVGAAFRRRAGAKHLPRLAREERRSVARSVLPYGLALAPTQVLLYLNNSVSSSFILRFQTTYDQGLFAFGLRLAALVTAIQAGFSTFWGPYVYSHYRTEQERISRVHDMLNLLIFGFFCVLVMLEDVIFLVFPAYRECLTIFPLLMLSVVFTILCEGTVYGNSIARRPYHDTIGIAIGAVVNLALCALLVPRWGLFGAALSLAAANGCMFLYRTVLGQSFYRTISSYSKTLSGFLLAFGVTAIGILCAGSFWLKFVLTGGVLIVYCSLYRSELARLWQMARGFLVRLYHRS